MTTPKPASAVKFIAGKKIPVSELKAFSDKHGLVECVLVGREKDNTVHVMTYGKSKKQCLDAANSGNNLKRYLGWPEEKCHDKPERLK